MISIEQIRPEVTWRLRRDILYPAEEIAGMILPEDTDGFHFGAFDNNKLVGVISLFQQGDNFQFRKFAVDPAIQNQGIGTELLDFVSAFAIRNQGTHLWCNARLTAAGFYEKCGFKKTDKVFSRNDHDYVIMEKGLVGK